MAIRLTGLASGLDTDSMVKELVSAYSKKLESYQKDKTKMEWKQEAWSSLNTKIYGFYTGALSSMRMTSSFESKKKVTVSDPTKATVSANGAVSNGTQTIEVKQMAKAGYLTSSKISDSAGNKVNAKTTLGELGMSNPGAFNIEINGKSTSISYAVTDTISDLTKKIKEETGLSASFDTNNQRLIISSASGVENDFTVSSFTEDGLKDLAKLGLLTEDAFKSYASFKDMQDYNKAMEEYQKKVEEYAGSAEAADYQQKLQEYNTKLEEYNEQKKKYDDYIALKAEMEANGHDTSTLPVVDDPGDAPEKPEKPANAPGEPPVKQSTHSADEIAEKIGVTSFATKQDATNAIIVVNGAEYENASNSLTVNGLTVNATGVTDGAISVTTSTDTDGVYNMIKDFIKEYNTIVNDMTKAYNAKSAKGYEPLTDEEKDSMSESEVEKWETKIKDALLRRDDSLSSILSVVTQTMQRGIEINGKTYNLSTFGIHTQSITSAKTDEYNAMHIDGDKEDSVTSDATDKLRAAIEADPDSVMSFFNQLAKNVYNTLTDKMKSTSLSSAYTIYNDKQMKEDLKKIESNISSWEKKVSAYEEKWYKQFSKMETALSELQSQTNSLTSLLGM